MTISLYDCKPATARADERDTVGTGVLGGSVVVHKK